MAESTVIKEFLVALGYKVDESGAKKFREGVTSVTKAVEHLGVRIEATALAVAYGVMRFASNLEQLYFAAQRTGSSADQLQAFGLAARNFGSSIEEAQGSVEGLAATLRSNPGMSNVIAGWLGTAGISSAGLARDTHGQLVASLGLMGRLGQMFQTQIARGQMFQATAVAGMLGISDHTMLAMSAPGFQAELAAQEKRRQGWEKVAEAAHRFMNQLEELKMAFFQMMLGFEGPAMRALQGAMTKLSQLMKDHGKQLVTDLSIAFTWVIDGIGHLIDWLDTHGKEIFVRLEALFLEFNLNWELYIKPTFNWLYDRIAELDKATDGWSTKIGLVLIGLKALGATGIVTGILGVGAGLAKAMGAGAGAAVEGGWTVAGTLFGVAAAGAIGAALGSAAYHFMPESWQRHIGNFVGGTVEALSRAIEFADKGYAADAAMAEANNPYASWRDRGGGNLSSKIELNMTVSGSGQPETLAKHIASEAEAALRRAQADLVREFSSRVN
jgi:hypothetical protein